MAAKIGPWGGNGGTAQDVDPKPRRMVSVTIRSSGECIHAISFTYLGHDNAIYSVGPWGGAGGTPNQIILDPTNYVTEISGTMGKFGNKDVVTSLEIVTLKGNPKTYGKANGTPFRIPLLDGAKVVGFFGCSSDVLDAIGIYVNP